MPKASFGDVCQYLRRMYPSGDVGDRPDDELLHRFVTASMKLTLLPSWSGQRHGPEVVLGVCRAASWRCALGRRRVSGLHSSFWHSRAAAIRSRTMLGGTWLYAVARRVALKARAKGTAYRNRERQSRNMARGEQLDEETWKELKSIIDEEIGRLPQKYQAPLVLCYLEGKSHSCAAKEIGCPKTTLKRRLGRGRELLRQQLIRRGVTLSVAALTTALCEKVMAAPVAGLLTINTVTAAARIIAGKATAGAA